MKTAVLIFVPLLAVQTNALLRASKGSRDADNAKACMSQDLQNRIRLQNLFFKNLLLSWRRRSVRAKRNTSPTLPL